jgi:hypothetical protein
MRTPLRILLLLWLVAVMAAACSSGAGAAGSGADDDGNGGAAATQPVAESTAPSEEAAEDDPALSPGTALDACEIVTAEDVASATGIDLATIGQGELTESPTTLSPGHTECDYTGEWGGVIVSLTPEDGANLYDAARGAYADASDREITGADGAFWSDETGRGFFWKGAVTVMMQVGFLADGGDRDAIVTALGQAALDKVD